MTKFEEDPPRKTSNDEVLSNTISKDEKKKLTHIVERIKTLNAQIQTAKWEIKELADASFEKCGVTGKATKQMAKEAAWDDVKREAVRQFEEECDKCRVALGMLTDTPLGQAELQRMEEEKQQSVKGTNAKKRPKGKAETTAAAAN